MPEHAKSAGKSSTNEHSDKEEDEDLFGFILYEDVCEYLFSLCSEESRLFLVTQFIEFFGGKISQRMQCGRPLQGHGWAFLACAAITLVMALVLL